MRELVDYRLAQYRARQRRSTATVQGFPVALVQLPADGGAHQYQLMLE